MAQRARVKRIGKQVLPRVVGSFVKPIRACCFVSVLLLVSSVALADISDCSLNPPADEELRQRSQYSIYRTILETPGQEPVVFLKDINPRKPNRWLAVPRKYYVRLSDMPRAERILLWKEAIRKAEQLWGSEWGLAINGDLWRTQCHLHIHIGKLLKGVELDNFVYARRVEEFPVPRDGTGLWVHPHGKGFHVHVGEQLTETVLLR